MSQQQLSNAMNVRQPSVAPSRRGRRGEHGQILVVAVLSLVAIIGGVSIVLEGGNAYAQQRATQNATDAAAEAGATVVGQWQAQSGASDTDVKAAVEKILADNGIERYTAYYTDHQGHYLSASGSVVATADGAAAVGGGSIPVGSKGVRVDGAHTFPTYLGRALGVDSFTAGTSSTAIAGPLTGGVFLPIVFPINVSDCDTSGDLGVGEENWKISQPGDPPIGQEYIVPLCKVVSGNFMIIDLDPNLSCSEEVLTPPAVQWDLPTYVDADNGNDCAKKVADAVNATLRHHVVTVPVCDAICAIDKGSHAQYHIVKVASFYLDYMSESNSGKNNACDPVKTGLNAIAGNGSSSCVVGWFVRWITAGPVGDGDIGNSDAIGVQLIR